MLSPKNGVPAIAGTLLSHGELEMDATVDITPTWGDIGNLFMRLALSSELQVIENMRPEFARAMACAQALAVIEDTLTDEQMAMVANTVQREMAKQGL